MKVMADTCWFPGILWQQLKQLTTSSGSLKIYPQGSVALCEDDLWHWFVREAGEPCGIGSCGIGAWATTIVKYVVIACVGNRLAQNVGAGSAFAKIAL